MSRPKNSCRNLPQLQKLPIRAEKFKNYPKIRSKLNVRIEGNKENESCSTTQVDPETVFKPYPNQKIAH